jgi:hypothetical protein
MKILSVTLFTELVPALRKPPLKVVPKSACDPKLFRKPVEKFDAAFGTIFVIDKRF